MLTSNLGRTSSISSLRLAFGRSVTLRDMDIALVTSLAIGIVIVGAILLMDWARRR